MKLPYITVCSDTPFKNGSLHFTEESYQNSTVDLGELFHLNEGMKTTWNVSELRSLINGRCYTFKHEKPVVSLSSQEVVMGKMGKELNVYSRAHKVTQA